MPSALTLRHVDAARNMNRFYRLDVQPDLFGEWSLVREWGRIGRPGQVRLESFPSAPQAEAALKRVQAAKVSRGYSSIGPPNDFSVSASFPTTPTAQMQGPSGSPRNASGSAWDHQATKFQNSLHTRYTNGEPSTLGIGRDHHE